MPATETAVWDTFLSTIQQSLNSSTFNTWFTKLEFSHVHNNKLIVNAPGNYFGDYVTIQYREEIERAVEVALGEAGELLIRKGEVPENPHPAEPATPSRSIQSLIPARQEPYTPDLSWTTLNAKYQFHNFIEGDGNRMARSAAMACANKPGKTIFNPLFVYGDVGLGKTHLIQAIGNQVVADNPNRKVLYLASETYYHHYVETTKENRSTDFANLFRNVNVLILDDIQFLTGKEKTQVELFHTFNILFQAGKQLVFSSDRPPKDLKGMEFRLISRLGSGFTIDLQPLDLETRSAILVKRAEELDTELPDDVIHFIAANVTSNIRELEQALVHVMGMASLKQMEITLPLAKSALQRIISERPVTIGVDLIQKSVAEFFEIPESKLLGKTRTKKISTARHMAMYLTYRLTNNSKKDIGLFFGGKDHSSVIYAIRNVENSILTDPETGLLVDNLIRRIRQTASS